MAENLLDNARTQEAGLPKIPRNYEKALRWFSDVSEFSDALCNIYNDYSRESSRIKTSGFELWKWAIKSLADFFNKSESDISNDAHNYGLKNFDWLHSRELPLFLNKPSEGMTESPLETAERLSDLDSNLEAMKSLIRNRDKGFKLSYSKKDEGKSFSDLWDDYNHPFVHIGINGPEGDITWDMLKNWLGEDFFLDPVMGIRPDKTLPKPWYESVPYEVEDE